MLDVKKWIAKVTNSVKNLLYDSGVKNVYGAYCQYRKRGNVVHVWGFSNDWNIATGGYRALTTLPSEARPSANFTFPCGALGGDAQITCRIQPDGLVYLYSTKTTSYWTFSTCYVVGGVVRRLLKALQSLSYRKAVVVC